MIAVLSPAKTLDFDRPLSVDRYTRPAFLDAAADLVATAQALSPDEIGELMNINGDLAQRTAEWFGQWRVSRHDSAADARQALFAFRGEVYRGLDADALSEEEIARAQDRLRILSGLYGMLRPLDLMLPYRLEMGSQLRNDRGSNLYEFWGNTVARALDDELRRERDGTLINLASWEYFRAVDRDELSHPVVTPVFKDRKNGSLRTIGVYAKRQRGRMARFLVREDVRSVADLKHYRDDGYRFDPDGSTESELLFVR